MTTEFEVLPEADVAACQTIDEQSAVDASDATNVELPPLDRIAETFMFTVRDQSRDEKTRYKSLVAAVAHDARAQAALTPAVANEVLCLCGKSVAELRQHVATLRSRLESFAKFARADAMREQARRLHDHEQAVAAEIRAIREKHEAAMEEEIRQHREQRQDPTLPAYAASEREIAEMIRDANVELRETCATWMQIKYPGKAATDVYFMDFGLEQPAPNYQTYQTSKLDSHI